MTDAAGREKPSTPNEFDWHPSFRYFRFAQVADEVFDAYRNLFLALESVLRTATPLRRQEDEREYDWFLRALNDAAAAGIDLSRFAPAGADDPAAAIRGELYSEIRIATFHAKMGERRRP